MTTLRFGLTDIELAELLGQKLYLILLWKKRIARGESFRPHCCPDFFDRWELGEDDLWKEKGGTPGITNVELAKKLSDYLSLQAKADRARNAQDARSAAEAITLSGGLAEALCLDVTDLDHTRQN